MVPSVRDRVSLRVTRYRRAHDHEGRWALCIDGKEVAGLGSLSAYAHEDDLFAQPSITGGLPPALAQPRVVAELRARGLHPLGQFYRSVGEYVGLPIDEALKSSDVLIRSLSILDRRLGKRRLLALGKNSALTPIEQRCLELRLECEAISSE
jgi:hypothetical protein